MHALFSIVLVLLCLANTVAPQTVPPTPGQPDAPPTAQPGGSPAAPATPAAIHPAAALGVEACGDGLQFFLLLEDPDLQTEIVGIAECGESVVVAVVHACVSASGGLSVWPALYTFPSSIFAHPIVQVPFRAEEME
jgi:hypothetical protein